MTGVFIPTPTFLTANHRPHWAVKARITAQIRHDAAWAARAARLPHHPGPVKVTALIHRGHAGRGRFDPANWAPTLKPALDGLVDAGVLDDDDSQHVVAVEIQAGPPNPGRPGVTIHITEEAR